MLLGFNLSYAVMAQVRFWNGPATKLVRSEFLWTKASSVGNMLWLRLFFSVYRELIPVMFRDSDLYILLANRAGAE